MMMMMMRSVAVLSVLATITSRWGSESFVAQAFSPSCRLPHRISGLYPLQTASIPEQPPTEEDLEQEVESLKMKALMKLDSLLLQMEDYQKENQKAQEGVVHHKEITRHGVVDDDRNPESLVERILESTRESSTASRKAAAAARTTTPAVAHENQKWKPRTALLETPPLKDNAASSKMNLLEDTRWKCVLTIGREPGTWMPTEWAASGGRLVLGVTMDFTDTSAHDEDDFFQGKQGTKLLETSQAYIFPHGTGTQSVGRRPLPVLATGIYKVCRGQGPAGTDVVRFCLELTESLELELGSDVTCPSGRIYGTCGYFPQHKTAASASWKAALQEEHAQAVKEYESLVAQNELDERLFSLDQLQRSAELLQVKRHMEKVHKQWQVARQREPELSQLRLSRDRKLGLSKEGGLCRKVHKGLALEYHILGRFEVASVDKKETATLDDDDTKRLLHP